MKCILLIRVSTEAQTYEEQEKEIRELAIKDWYKSEEIISVAYKESGRKLSEEERLGLNEMKSLIEKGGVNCVYAWEISRIARTKKFYLALQNTQRRKAERIISNAIKRRYDQLVMPSSKQEEHESENPIDAHEPYRTKDGELVIDDVIYR